MEYLLEAPIRIRIEGIGGLLFINPPTGSNAAVARIIPLSSSRGP